MGRLAWPSGLREFTLTPPANEQSTPAADSEDFDAIVENHSNFVYNVAYRVMGNPQEAEDVAQDAFLSAYRAYDRFRGQSHVTTWLYRITMNAALMRLRKTKKARTLTHTGIDEVEVVDWTKNPHKDALDSDALPSSCATFRACPTRRRPRSSTLPCQPSSHAYIARA